MIQICKLKKSAVLFGLLFLVNLARTTPTLSQNIEAGELEVVALYNGEPAFVADPTCSIGGVIDGTILVRGLCDVQTFTLEAGDHVLQPEYGGIGIGSPIDFTINAGATTSLNIDVSSFIGIVTGTVTINGEPPPLGSSIRSRTRTLISTSIAPDGSFSFMQLAESGTGEVFVSGEQIGSFPFTVIAGRTADVGTIGFGTGQFEVVALYNGEPAFVADPKCSIGGVIDGTILVRGLCDVQTFTLEAGDHVLQPEYGGIGIGSPIDFTINAGATTSLNIDVSSFIGIVTGTVTINGEPPPLGSSIRSRTRTLISTSIAPDGSFSFMQLAESGTGEVLVFGEQIGSFPFTVISGRTIDLGNVLNKPPVAQNDVYGMFEDGTLIAESQDGVLTNDSDPDNDPLIVILVSNPTNGTLMIQPDGAFTYQPNHDFNGEDSFTYKANDGSEDSNVATVTITVTPVNDAPVAVDDEYSVQQNETLTITRPGVLANDSDVDGDPLTASLFSNPSNGTVTLIPDGSFTYQPIPGFHGSDRFSYTAIDAHDRSNEATVTIMVIQVNQPPVCRIDPTAFAIFEGQPLNFRVTVDDPEGEQIVLSVDRLPPGATMTPELPSGLPPGAAAVFDWVPEPGLAGHYEVLFSVIDVLGLESRCSVVIDVIPNEPPVCSIAPSGPLTVHEGQSLSFIVTAVDPEPAAGEIFLETPGLPPGATMTPSLPLTGSPSGLESTFNWTPGSGQEGNYFVQFIVTDPFGLISECAATIEVIGNQSPTVTCPEPVTAECNTGVTLSAPVTDPDGDALTVTWNVDGIPVQTDQVPAGGPPSSARVILSYVYPSGTHTVMISVNDGKSEPVSCTTTVTIVDRIPPMITLIGDNPLTLECSTSYTEPGATVIDECDPNPSLNISGSVEPGVPGNYLITYTATDASGNSATTTRTVEVIDTTPPSVTADLILRDLSYFRPDNRGKGNFEVVCSAEDGCDDTPINSALMVIPPGFDNSQVEIKYKPATGEKSEITFKKNKKGHLIIELEGEDENALMAQLNDILQSGGVTVTEGQVLQLHFMVKPKKGEKFGFTFINGTLIKEKVEGADPVITMVCSSIDEAGNEASETVTANFTMPVMSAKMSGKGEIANMERPTPKLPKEFLLEQNYPNPFNPETDIRFQLPQASHVVLRIFNTLGQEIRRLADTQYEAGLHSLRWDGRDNNGHSVSSGVYLYQMQAGDFVQVRKMSLLR